MFTGQYDYPSLGPFYVLTGPLSWIQLVRSLMTPTILAQVCVYVCVCVCVCVCVHVFGEVYSYRK